MMRLNITGQNRIVFLALIVTLFPITALTNSETDKILARAERYGWRDNWEKARPLFARAEKEYEAQGDLKSSIAAKIGFIQSRIHTTPSAQLLQLLDRELENPIVKKDLNLQLKCYIAKG